MLERLPHKGLGIFWIFWTLSTIPTLIATAIPGGWLQGLGWWLVWFVSFMIAETIVTRLLNTRLRETLSEVVSWAHRTMARKGIIAPDRGWTAAFTAIILLIALNGAMPWFVVASAVPAVIAVPLSMLGASQTYLVGRWLYDHWILTEDFG